MTALDPMTDVLSTLRMQSTLYFRADLRAPWGLQVPSEAGVVRFHVPIQGRAFVGVAEAVVPLQRGDLVLIPHGASHRLLAEPDQRAVPLADVLNETTYDGTTDLVYGGAGESTILVCGHFAFDDERLHPLIESLPPWVHLQASQGHDFTWLDAATRAVGMETARRPPGWEAMVEHVSAILFIQALRTAIGTNDAPAAEAFMDRQLGRALAAFHHEPNGRWTLEELGRVAGMSRTVFAERFKQAMGMPAIAYVTRWRLQRARRDLLDSGDIVAGVAARAGYASEAAFTRAFQRLYGMPPGAYRSQQGK